MTRLMLYFKQKSLGELQILAVVVYVSMQKKIQPWLVKEYKPVKEPHNKEYN